MLGKRKGYAKRKSKGDRGGERKESIRKNVKIKNEREEKKTKIRKENMKECKYRRREKREKRKLEKRE